MPRIWTSLHNAYGSVTHEAEATGEGVAMHPPEMGAVPSLQLWLRKLHYQRKQHIAAGIAYTITQSVGTAPPTHIRRLQSRTQSVD